MPQLKVSFLALDGVDAALVKASAEHALRVTGARYEVARVDDGILAGSYNPARRQFLASAILQNVERLYRPREGEKVLVIVNLDLYAYGLNFIFGQAQHRGTLGIVSTFRLGAPGAGRGFTLAAGLLESRLKKEVVHELGHLLGLNHCGDSGCVMYFSNTIRDTDAKGDTFCRNCAGRLKPETGG